MIDTHDLFSFSCDSATTTNNTSLGVTSHLSFVWFVWIRGAARMLYRPILQIFGWSLISFNKIDVRMRIVQLPARPFRTIRLDGRGCYLAQFRGGSGVARSACNGERGEAEG